MVVVIYGSALLNDGCLWQHTQQENKTGVAGRKAGRAIPLGSEYKYATANGHIGSRISLVTAKKTGETGGPMGMYATSHLRVL
jgi:hypothetical protein